MKPLANYKIVAQHADLCPRGNFIECGVFEGATSVAINKVLDLGCVQYAADTFEGMPYDGSDLEQRGGFVRAT